MASAMEERWANYRDVARRMAMKSYDSRTYSINDFVEWDSQKALKLNPVFQRRPVWSDRAKSYLIDTILRGKPMPKVFIRQKINVTTRSSEREIVDGQQRIRTILSYVRDGFAVSRRMNPDYGGRLFSQLPDDVQAQFLGYEIAVDLLINLPDSEILDIFSRLNSYAVILNQQELLHAKYFGPFKAVAEHIAHRYNPYWRRERIFSDREILRMGEVSLVADLLIAMMDGIKSKKAIASRYKWYEEHPDDVPDDLEKKFDEVTAVMGTMFPEGIKDTLFSRPYLFYSLFTAVAHAKFGVPDLQAHRANLSGDVEALRARQRLDRIGELLSSSGDDSVAALSAEERKFIEDSKRATTDEIVRKRRTIFLCNLMAG